MVRHKHQPRPALLGHELGRPNVQRAEHGPGAKAKYLASLELWRDVPPRSPGRRAIVIGVCRNNWDGHITGHSNRAE